jgi:FkbM family methyltransferase
MGVEEPEVAVLGSLISRGGTAVDVGANVGFYTRALARHFDAVHAFEPNERLVGPIVNWNHPAVHLHLVGLSSRPGVGTLHVPVVGGVILDGWGSLNANWVPEAENVVKQRVNLNCLDAYELSDVRFVKIDVEGGELGVLLGAMETIRRNRPLLLIETIGNTRREVTLLLSSIGYKRDEVQRIAGVRGSPQNVLFVADESC